MRGGSFSRRVGLLVAMRSLLYWAGFFLLSAVMTFATLATLVLPGQPIQSPVRGWSRGHRYLCRWVLGQKVRWVGALPQGARFIVMKHEAMFETIDMPHVLRGVVIPAKRELLDIPLWGYAARRYGLIPVEREEGAKALRALLAAVKSAITAGRPIVFFPEGTRVPHGQTPPLRSGFAALYTLLGEPVVPVAIDAGRLWPRMSWLRYPGTITYLVGEVVPPGLPRPEAERKLHAAINALNFPPE
jgi:1-acyl-sn-glycerol-3-phosphate acyltransferase